MQQIQSGGGGSRKFRVSLVGGPDPLGKANGKFIGYAVANRRADSDDDD